MARQTTNTTDGLTTTGTPPVSPLDSMDSMAAAIDAEHAGALPDGSLIADQPAPIDYATEAAATVDTIAALIGGYCPPAGAHWDTDKKAAVSMALAPVMEKYGFALGALPVELTLIIIAGPPLYMSAKLIAAQIGAEKAQVQAAKAGTSSQGEPMPQPPGEIHTGPEVKRHPQTALYT